jgi:hypothetical protein
VGIAAQLFLLYDSQVFKIRVGFYGGVVFRCWEALFGTRDVGLCKYFSALVQEGGAPKGPSGVENQGRDNVAVGASDQNVQEIPNVLNPHTLCIS